MENLAIEDEQQRKIKTIFRASAIQTRYSVLEDYGKAKDFSFFSNAKGMDPFPGTGSRMNAYKEHAIDLSLEAISNCKSHHPFEPGDITHLITVSCTGMYAPGLDIDIVNKMGLNSSVSRTCINFMGCFAAITGIKTADAFCEADPAAKVLVVCTELCSLHFQKEFTDDNILANALFADGAAALIIEPNPTTPQSLFIEGYHNNIVVDGAPYMAWTIGNLGFEMRLSSDVPTVLSKAIEGLVNNLLHMVHIDKEEVTYYAVHPGGKKILDAVGEKLNIPKSKLQYSYDVLRDYGNMSSPTILFVLHYLMNSGETQPGNQILGMAFGPGITMESIMLKVME
jgi:predicted naringenin-chalcone synthase